MSDSITVEELEELVENMADGEWLELPKTDAQDIIRISTDLTNKLKELEQINKVTNDLLDAEQKKYSKACNGLHVAEDLLNQMDEYLTPHPRNYIGNNSIFHCEIRDALATIKGDE